MLCKANSRRTLGIAALCAMALACGDGPPPTNGKVEGKRLALALAAHTVHTSTLIAPYRCARRRQEHALPVLPGLATSLNGPVLELGLGKDDIADSLTIAYVADARGADAETRRAIAKHRATFKEAGVRIIVSLGGLATKGDDLQSLLQDLLGDTQAILIAIPGDRESIPEHRAAIKRMAKTGARVLDGSYYQLIRVGEVVLANMPGIAMSSNLIAKMKGCQHLEIDAKELLRDGLREQDIILLNSYAPIRAEEIRAQDRGLGGIHVGELALVPLLQHTQIAAAIHAMVAPENPSTTGNVRISASALLLATGSLDALERKSEALLVTLAGTTLSWRRLRVD